MSDASSFIGNIDYSKAQNIEFYKLVTKQCYATAIAIRYRLRLIFDGRRKKLFLLKI
jgi:hypothetical protein